MQESIKRERQLMETMLGVVKEVYPLLDSLTELVEDYGTRKDQDRQDLLLQTLHYWRRDLTDRVQEIKLQSWDTW